MVSVRVRALADPATPDYSTPYDDVGLVSSVTIPLAHTPPLYGTVNFAITAVDDEGAESDILSASLSFPANLVCQSTPYEQQTVQNSYMAVGSESTNAFIGQLNYDYGSNRNLCRVDVWIYGEVGDVSPYNYLVEVYTQSGTSLGVLQGSSGLVSGSAIHSATKPYWQTFTFSTPIPLNTGTNYSIVVTRSDHSYNASNFIRLYHNYAGGSISGMYGVWNSDKTIFDYSSTSDFCFKLYNAQ